MMKPTFFLSETFDATPDVLWRAWTVGDELKKWFGPAGAEMTECKMDLRVGGTMFYALKFAAGNHNGLWKFLEIDQPHKFVFLQHFADANGAPVRHPWSEQWPMTIHSTIALTQKGDKTTCDITWTPHEATSAEEAEFEAGRPSMTQG
ncbi:MAG: SRPBCC domain-containing protein, partial [Hydrotalea sp.]|nr:SRPBCC domain-containing protein [Hydrotalea sp.]